MNLESTIERLWMRWVELEPGIPYWNPYGASIVLFIAIVILFNLARTVRRMRRQARPGFTYARMRADREKRAQKVHQSQSKQSSRF